MLLELQARLRVLSGEASELLERAAAAIGAAAAAREAARAAELAYGHTAPRLGARIDPRALGRLVECAEALAAGIEAARRVAERLDAPASTGRLRAFAPASRRTSCAGSEPRRSGFARSSKRPASAYERRWR